MSLKDPFSVLRIALGKWMRMPGVAFGDSFLKISTPQGECQFRLWLGTESERSER